MAALDTLTRPSLADLAQRTLAANAALNSAILRDADWNSANDAACDALAAFRGALEAETGITREVWDRLGAVL